MDTFYTAGRWEDYPEVFVGPRIPPGLRWRRTVERYEEREVMRSGLSGDPMIIELRCAYFIGEAKRRGGLEFTRPVPEGQPPPKRDIYAESDAWAHRMIAAEHAREAQQQKDKEAKNA